MSYFNILVGYDLRQTNLKQHGASHSTVKAIMVPDDDVQYESNSAFSPASQAQGIVELQFQPLNDNPVLMLQVSLINQYDTQLHVYDVVYYHATSQVQLTTQEHQNIIFKSKLGDILAEVVVTEIVMQGVCRFPLVEINLNDFQFPQCKLFFSNFLAVEVQTDQMKIVKLLGGRHGDLSNVLIPYQPELLVKIIFICKIGDKQHQFTLFNMKVYPNQLLTKGALFSVEDIDLQLGSKFLCFLDTIIQMQAMGQEVYQNVNSVKVQFNNVVTPGFLNKYVLYTNNKLVDINKTKYAQVPWPIETDNKKFQKIISNDITNCEELTLLSDKYNDFKIVGNVMFYIESSFVPKECHPNALFMDFQPLHKSIAILAAKIDPSATGFGFILLNNKEIQHQKLIQKFEIGTGNIAICKPIDNKLHIQMIHRGNISAVVKLLTNNVKSLIASSGKGISMNILLYEKGNHFRLQKINFSKKQLEEAAKSGTACLDSKITQMCTLRLYCQDMIYQESHEIADFPHIPDENNDLESGRQSSVDNQSFSRQSMMTSRVVVKQTVFDPRKVFDYFGGKSKMLFLLTITRPSLTFQDSLDDEIRRIQAEKQRIIDERLRVEAEKLRIEKEALEKQQAEERQAALDLQNIALQKEKERELQREQSKLRSSDWGMKDDGQFDAFEFARRKEEEERKEAEILRKKEEEERRQEELRKLQLKKQRNLKFQQQIQRFLVAGNGKVATFYNDKMDKEERAVVEKVHVLPKREVISVLQGPIQKDPVFDTKPVQSVQKRVRLSGQERALAEIHAGTDVEELAQTVETQRSESQNCAKNTFFPIQPDETVSAQSYKRKLKNDQILVPPIVFKTPNAAKAKQVNKMLSNLYSSPLNRRVMSVGGIGVQGSGRRVSKKVDGVE